ncbi:MAG: HAD-IC family P-type ATPase [Candidatus Lokiarchaeota archaeon]|nr:HAD-IC family P-type ATPase [Candidatus Lokiarchaeota archaeon]MBD3338097.1 HAD-IC family P-type ATPase [Candidatus Lokiarchaeota archaeon]
MEIINAHCIDVDAVSKALDTEIENGLSKQEAQKRLEKYGLNELVQRKKVTPWEIFTNQFKDFLVYLLFFAIAVSIVVGTYELLQGNQPSEYLDALVIFIILIVNAILGFYQEYKAEKSLESLKKMAPHSAKVKRDGIVKEIDIREVVPGDILQLNEGDKIPADARLTSCYSMYVDEAILTGESKPVNKCLGAFEEKCMLADRKNMVYSNTIITRGNGTAIVVATGMDTEIGKIAEKIQEEEPEPSPFQQEVDRFGRQLGKLIMLACLAIFVIEFVLIIATEGLVFDEEQIDEIINTLTVAISLAVSAVPEGLVVVITVVMSIGMRKMADRNALVKTLTAVETLGRVTIICSDKTGTLTKNEMTVVKIFLGGTEYDVEGVGYSIEGKIVEGSGSPLPLDTPYLERFLQVGYLCNNANVAVKKGTNKTHVIGDPTEICLKVLAMKMDLDVKADKINEIPFSSDRKMMSVAVTIDGQMYSLIKGAPDVIMKNATKAIIDGQEKPIGKAKDILLQKNEEFARNALRVLGLAYRPLDKEDPGEEMEKDYTYLGLVGIIDPARDEVKASIEEARMAGIRTIMITGDHKITAIAIAKEIGLTDKEDAVTGAELSEMDDETLARRVMEADVFARVTSEDKLRILNVLKKQDNIVSMTGDGVNDAPAVKGAQVGVAMGLKGTEVTQEASDVILIDDNYATIVNAIEEGRGIFETTKSFFRYMLSANFDEIIMILTAWILMKLFVNIYLAQPLEPIQILWLNIATDGIPAMVLGLTPTDPDVMKFRPRKGFNMISDIKTAILFAAIFAAITDVLLYVLVWSVLIPAWQDIDPRLVNGAVIWGRNLSGEEYQIAVAQSIVFTNVVFFELFFVYSCTSEFKPLWEFPNKHLFWATGISFTLHILILFTPLGIAFHTVPMDCWYHWVAIFMGSIWILPAEEFRKYLKRKRQREDPLWQKRLTDHHRKN